MQNRKAINKNHKKQQKHTTDSNECNIIYNYKQKQTTNIKNTKHIVATNAK